MNIPNCGICTVSTSDQFCPPEGSYSPEWYFLGEAPGLEESIIKEDGVRHPFIGISGQLLREVIRMLGIEHYRIFNAVCCRPTDSGGNRTPTDSEVKNCIGFSIMDISKYSSTLKGIICCGEVPYAGLTGAVSGTEINGIKIHRIYHPAYILRKGGRNSPDFKKWVESLKKIITGVSTVSDSTDFVYSVTSEKDILDEYISASNLLSLDVESNGYDTYHRKFRTLGAGFYNGVSAPIYYTGPTIHIKPHLINKNKEYLVYNASYEGITFFNLVGVHPYDINYIDVHKLAVVLNHFNKLQEFATEVLSVARWKDEVGKISESIKSMVRVFRTIAKKTPTIKTVGDIVEALSAKTTYYKYEENFIASFSYLSKILDRNELHNIDISELITDYENGEKTSFYEFIPVSMVAEMCCKDNYYTYKVYEKLYDTKNVKITQPFEVHNDESILGCAMTAYGIPIIGDVLRELKVKALEDKLWTTKEFLLTDVVSSTLKLKDEDIEIIKSTNDIEKLGKYVNLTSTHISFRDLLSKSMYTEIARYAYVLHVLSIVKDKLPSFEIENLLSISNNELLNELSNPIEIGKCIKILVDDGYKRFTPRERVIVDECLKPQLLENLEEGTFEPIYKCLTSILKDSIVNPILDETKVLRSHRIFKKASKAIGTYIEGSCGFGSCYNYNEVDNDGTIFYQRDDGNDHKLVLSDGNYFVNGAFTRRWTATVHTMPPHSPFTKARVTHFGDDGICLKFDHSQFELRVIAKMANDAVMQEVFKNNGDIHDETAKATGLTRRGAKTINFGIIYGSGVDTIANDIFNGDRTKAQDIFNLLFGRFSGLGSYIKMCHDRVRSKGFTTNIFGEEIFIKFDPSKNWSISDAERQSVNYGVQSTASCLAAYAIHKTDRDRYFRGMKSMPYIFTHDAGEFSTLLKELLTMISLCKKNSERGIIERFDVHSKIDIEIGVNSMDLVGLSIDEFDEDHLYGRFTGTAEACSDLYRRLLREFKTELSSDNTETKDITVLNNFFRSDAKQVWSDDIFKLTEEYMSGPIKIERK